MMKNWTTDCILISGFTDQPGTSVHIQRLCSGWNKVLLTGLNKDILSFTYVWFMSKSSITDKTKYKLAPVSKADSQEPACLHLLHL